MKFSSPEYEEVLTYWFWDAKEEVFRDTRTNKIVCYANKEKQKEYLTKFPDDNKTA
jgi:hypothetical protein